MNTKAHLQGTAQTSIFLLVQVQKVDRPFLVNRNPLCNPLYWWLVLLLPHVIFSRAYINSWNHFWLFFLRICWSRTVIVVWTLAWIVVKLICWLFAKSLKSVAKVVKSNKNKSKNDCFVWQFNTIPGLRDLLANLCSASRKLLRPFWKSSLSRIRYWCLIYEISQIDNWNKCELHFLGGWPFGFINFLVNRLNEAQNDNEKKP